MFKPTMSVQLNRFVYIFISNLGTNEVGLRATNTTLIRLKRGMLPSEHRFYPGCTHFFSYMSQYPFPWIFEPKYLDASTSDTTFP